MHRAARVLSEPTTVAHSRAPDADPPRPHGWRSLSRSSPTSRIPRRSRRHRRVGFEPSGSFSENRAPTSCRGLGEHVAWAGRVSSCRAELRLRALRETEDTGVTPQAPPLAPVRDAPSRPKPPHGDPLAHSREHAIRHPRVGAFVTRSVGGPRKSCLAAAERRSTNRRYVRPMSAQSLE